MEGTVVGLSKLQATVFKQTGSGLWMSEKYFIQVKIRFICYSDRSHCIRDGDGYCGNRSP